MFSVFLIFSLFCCHYFALGSDSENNTREFHLWQEAIVKYQNLADDTSCSNDLSALAKVWSTNSVSGYNSRRFFESWKLNTPYDLWSIGHFSYIAKDLTCKMDRPNFTHLWPPNRYCIYEKMKPQLKDGFLLALCVPNSCNDSEATNFGRVVSDISLFESKNVTNEQIVCVTAEIEPFGYGFYATVFISFMLIFLSLLATAKQIIRGIEEEKKHPVSTPPTTEKNLFIRIFSLQNNFRKLVRCDSDHTMDCLHFIKALIMVLIILCHAYLFTQIFASNLEGYLSYRYVFFYQVFYNGSYLAGTFITIAGILAAYVTLTKFKHKPKFSIIPWLFMIVYRYFRIIPLYLFCMLIITFLFPYALDFPSWYPVDPLLQCPHEIWRHMLFLNNFKKFQLCMTWTWYLAVDFQLFLAFIPVVALFVYKPKIAIVMCLICIVATSAVRVALVLINDFPPALMMYLYLPQYNMNFATYAFEVHMKPYAWAPSYACGLLVGYTAFWLREKNWTAPLRKSIEILLWAFTLLSIFWTPFGIYCNTIGFKNVFYDSLYVALSPVCWSLACGWITIHAHFFLKSWVVKKFLALRIWLVLSNLTFGCYLVHLVFTYGLIFKYATDKGGHPKVHLPYTHFYGIFGCVVLVSYIVSFLFYLLVEGPASNFQAFLMKKFFYRPSKKTQSEKIAADEDETLTLEETNNPEKSDVVKNDECMEIAP